MATGKLVVAVTGASGAIYAQRFVRRAARLYDEVLLMVSRPARLVAEAELGASASPWRVSEWLGEEAPSVRMLDGDDFFTPPASGSFRHDGMVIVPCSMGTVGRIAHGVSEDLVTRAADVCLKEGRKLILVPREAPLSLIMLRNLTTLCEAGATILPASPAWYDRPASLEELADTIVARILQNLGVEHGLVREWMTP